MEMRNILCLDLGTTTGWASLNNKMVTSGTISFKPQRFEGGGMRYLRFEHWLNEIAPINAVYFEEVRKHLGVDAAHVYGGFLSHLTSWCEEHKIPYQGIPVTTIKKFISGRGNASKEEVINKITSRGYLPQDDNEADAIALLCYVRAVFC
jgi:Holliday junction resolvasome RuvABC endonuclease subunit